jgi:LPXTG-motif cell wall-anchored protein
MATGLGLLAGPAGADTQSFSVQCKGTLNGTDISALIPAQDLKWGATSPTEVNAGSQFTVTFPSFTTALPASSGGIAVTGYKNLSTTYSIEGGTFVSGTINTTSAPTLDGSPVTGTASLPDSHTIKMTIPGPISPGQLAAPVVTVKVQAGAAGTTFKIHGAGVDLTAVVSLGEPNITCDAPTNTLSTTQVVAPPPPGAPDAVADIATTKHDTAVNINVLKNDKPNPDIAFDPNSVEITSNPGHGTATVEADHTVTYTPAAGFHGTDEFDYKLCSQAQEIDIPQAAKTAAVEGPACDTATVTVTVTAPVVATTTTTTVATAGSTAAPATTVAAAANELPRTGGSSTPLALIGAGMLGLGLLALSSVRRRHA